MKGLVFCLAEKIGWVVGGREKIGAGSGDGGCAVVVVGEG